MPWPKGCCPGPKCHPRNVDGQAGWEWVSHKSHLSLAVLLQEMRNPLANIQGSPPAWVFASLQQPQGLLQNPHLSIYFSLLAHGCWPASRQTQWVCAPFQIGRVPLTDFAVLECRFPLPYLVLGGKKAFVLSILTSARNLKFWKLFPKSWFLLRKEQLRL